VYVLTDDRATSHFCSIVGRGQWCFGGMVRMYAPGLRHGSDAGVHVWLPHDLLDEPWLCVRTMLAVVGELGRQRVNREDPLSASKLIGPRLRRR